ncbi:MAG: methyltransferase domain-containing protein [Micromonosporaceae bacterium]
MPRFLRDDNTVVDGASPDDRAEWVAAVYADTSLVTQSAAVPDTDLYWPTSSATKPSLMADMLHLLDVRDGHNVLEIGTGTGYNAALLCHRLGDANVASIDIHPDLIAQARTRLAAAGYCPHLAAGDGATGLPEHAPYDRIIVTCAVAAVQPAWIEQLTDDGLVVADVRGELISSLIALSKNAPDAVEGRFLPAPGHFMWMRTAADNPLRDGRSLGLTVDRTNATHTTTGLDPAVLDQPDLRFLLQHLSPRVEQIWRTERDVLLLHSYDGAWAELDTLANGGVRHVLQGGPRPIWDLV